MLPVLVFDVNETLLDLSAFDRHFEQYLGDAAVRGIRRYFERVFSADAVRRLKPASEPYVRS